MTGANGAAGKDAPSGISLPLLAVFPDARLTRRAKSTVRATVFVTGPAKVELRAVKGKRTWRAATTVSGTRRVTLQLGRLPRGRYSLTLIGKRGTARVIDRGHLVVR